MVRRYPDSQKEADKRYESQFKSLKVRLSLEIHHKLKTKAQLLDTSISALVREAIENAVADSLEKHGADEIDTNTAHINNTIEG